MQASRLHLLTSRGPFKSVLVIPNIGWELPVLNEKNLSTASYKKPTKSCSTVSNDKLSEKCSSTSDDRLIKNKKSPKIGTVIDNYELPPAPTSCCMSGCQNCVWLAYAEELRNTLSCSSEESKAIILDQIDDPNMKAFLKLELTFLDGSCQYRPGGPAVGS